MKKQQEVCVISPATAGGLIPTQYLNNRIHQYTGVPGVRYGTANNERTEIRTTNARNLERTKPRTTNAPKL